MTLETMSNFFCSPPQYLPISHQHPRYHPTDPTELSHFQLAVTHKHLKKSDYFTIALVHLMERPLCYNHVYIVIALWVFPISKCGLQLHKITPYLCVCVAILYKYILLRVAWRADSQIWYTQLLACWPKFCAAINRENVFFEQTKVYDLILCE